MPRTRFSRASIFAARCGNGGKTFEFRFTRPTYQIAAVYSRFVFSGNGRRYFSVLSGIVTCYFSVQMDNQPAPNPSRSSMVSFWSWLFVLVVLLFVGLIRVRLLDMPLERDEGEYAYAGQLILQGVPPYELAYNMKLPGTYFIYALGMAVFGETSAGVHLTLLAANALTIVFVFLLARKLFGTTAGLVACASYGVMSVSVPVLGMAAHATQFVVLFAVPATLLLWNAVEKNLRWTLFFSGLLYGLAFLMKQQGICFCLFGWLFVVAKAMREKSLLSPGFMKKVCVFSGGMLLPFGLTCLVLACAGVFSRFWFWTFTYAHSYVTAVSLSEGWQHLVAYLKGSFDVTLGFWVILILGLPLAFCDKGIRRQTFFAAGFGLFSFLGVAVGLYFRTHYFVMALPAFAILTGASVVSMQRAVRFQIAANVFKSLPLILFATALSWVVYYQSQFFFEWSPAQNGRIIYGLDPFEESIAVAQYVRDHSAPDTRIAVVGSEPEIYFYAHRRSATGYIYTYTLMESQPNALEMQRDMIREIETNQPEFLLSVACGNSWLIQPRSDRTILRWCEEYAGRFYEPVGFVRKSSAGGVESFWDEAAKAHLTDGGEYIVIYKLKPEP
jgi:4-amino-4-deoxy-L-arabinose transferase-like glycosyltransferase